MWFFAFTLAMSGLFAAEVLLLSATGLSGGAWAFFRNSNPVPLTVVGVTTATLIWSMHRQGKEQTRRGQAQWLLMGWLGSIQCLPAHLLECRGQLQP